MRVKTALIFALLAAVLPRAGHSAESFDNCSGFITSLPAVITTQGVWCMDRDLASAQSSGVLVAINANNVTLDCNHYKIGNLAAGPGTSAYGIYSAHRLNATVRNCNVRGARIGINLVGSGHLVADNRLDANWLVGIYTEGDNNQITGNTVLDTGGGAGIPVAIQTGAGSVDVSSNTVTGVEAAAGAVGIHLFDASYSSLRGNVVRGVVRGVSGPQVGVEITGATEHTDVSGNRFFGVSDGEGEAVRCLVSDSATVSNNVFLGNATAFVACNDGGGNVVN